MDDKFVVPSFFSILEVILTALAVPSFPSSSNDFFQLGVSVGIYLFKFSNRNFRTMYEICWTLTIETLERHEWHYWYLYFQLWTDFTHFFGVCFVEFEQANAKKLRRTNNYYGKANFQKKLREVTSDYFS